MIKLKALDEFIKEYKNDKFSDKEIEIIIKNVFNFVKKEMSDGEFNEIRLKYFGVFKVFPGRLKALIKKKKWQYEKGYKEKEEFLTLENHLLKKIEELEKFKK